ncbi:TetR family transcriptional regulator [Streptomyces sp. S6]|nr:TetR family transcriptional regulator [Streptomyces sp. S6]
MTKQVRAARTRQALIRSAAIVFEQHGYALISSGAGVSTGALHFHFENKAAVAQAVVAEASHGLLEVSSSIRRRTDTALQTLVDTSHALVDLLARDPVTRAGFRLSCDGVRGDEPGLPAQWQRCVGELLDEAAAAGTLAEGVSRTDATAATVAATTGFEVLGRYDSEWLSAPTPTGFWRLLLPPPRHPGDPAPPGPPRGTAAATDAVATGPDGHRTSGVGAAAPI